MSAADLVARPGAVRSPRLLLGHLWILYPAALFALPNGWRPAGLRLAPESLLALALLCVAVPGDLALRGGRRTLAAIRAIPVSARFLLVWLAFAWSASDSPAAARGVLHVLLWGATLFAAIFFARETGAARVLLVWRALACIAAAAFLLSPGRWSRLTVDLFAWEHRTTLGYFLALPAALALYRFLVGARRMRACLESALLVGGLAVTYSRGPWIAATAALFAMLVLSRRRRLALALALVTAAGIGATLAFTARSESVRRVRSIADLNVASSSRYRLDLYAAAARSIEDFHLLGHGPGSSGAVLREHTAAYYPHLVTAASATDSDLVWLLVEAGPPAALALVAVLVALARRVCRESDPTAAALCVVFLVMILLDNVLSSALGWFLLGCAIAWTREPEGART